MTFIPVLLVCCLTVFDEAEIFSCVQDCLPAAPEVCRGHLVVAVWSALFADCCFDPGMIDFQLVSFDLARFVDPSESP